MDSPRRISSQQVPSPAAVASSGDFTKSPEFEFWRVRHPSFPEPNLLSADELFADGVLLPLHLLHQQPPSSQPQHPISQNPIPAQSSSKRWKLDIFNKTTTTKHHYQQHYDKDKEKENPKVKHHKEKKKERKSTQGGSSSAELNINIWPFSRSRSAGNSGAPPRIFPGTTRKVSSAPCSRSNSAGESKSRKWPSSPSRAGLHLGRSSPIWQVRRGNGKTAESPVVGSNEKMMGRKQRNLAELRASKTTVGDNTKTTLVNLNVPMCTGCRQHLRCRSHETASEVRKVNGSGRNSTSKSNLGSGGFNLRSLFSTKKIY